MRRTDACSLCWCAGIALHTPGLMPYCATFFIFTDYMRAAMRMSALSEAGVIYVMTHDSIGLGEDGPTHQVPPLAGYMVSLARVTDSAKICVHSLSSVRQLCKPLSQHGRSMMQPACANCGLGSCADKW